MRFHADRWPAEIRAIDPSGLRSQLDELAGPESGFRVADLDGAVVGLISANLLDQPTTGMYRYDGPIVWIGDIVVTESARGRGIGALLLAEIEEWARSRGAKHLQLNTHYGNDAALELYERSGYRCTDIRLRKDL